MCVCVIDNAEILSIHSPIQSIYLYCYWFNDLTDFFSFILFNRSATLPWPGLCVTPDLQTM